MQTIEDKLNKSTIHFFDKIHHIECGVRINYHLAFEGKLDEGFYLDFFDGTVIKYNKNTYFTSKIFDSVTLKNKVDELMSLPIKTPVIGSYCAECPLIQICPKGREILETKSDDNLQSINNDLDKLSESFDAQLAESVSTKLRLYKIKYRFITTLIDKFKDIILKYDAKGGYGVVVKSRTDTVLNSKAALILANVLALNADMIKYISLKITDFKKSKLISDKDKSELLNNCTDKVNKTYAEFR